MNSLTIGTPGDGFAELRLMPGGSVTTAAGMTIQNRGRLFGSGNVGGPVAVEASGEITALTGDSLTFDSPVTNHGSVNVINGTLTFAGDGTIGGDPNDGLTNLATLNLINAVINGDVHSPGGSTINVGAGVVFNGLVSGGGDFPGAGLVTFNGGYDPGDSPAFVSFNGGVVFGSANTLRIEIGGLTAGVQYDQLSILGDATLDGDLLVELIDDFTPLYGDAFTILDLNGTRTGIFAGLGEGAIVSSTGGQEFSITYYGGDGNDVVLTAIPEPTTLSLLGLGAMALLRRRRRV